MESRDGNNVREFFRQWPQNSESKNFLLLPLSNLIQYVSGSDAKGPPTFYIHTECLPIMVQFLKKYDMEFTSFYAARIINILMRQCCEESIAEPGGKGFYGKTFPLFENLISVIFDQHTIEKREVLMCFASVFKFVVENQRPMKEEKQTRKNILTTIAKIEMIDAKVVEAILHCFKFINEWQFKAEVKDSKTISKIKQQEVQQETKYVTIENNLVDTKKMGKATYQMDLLTRQNMSNVNEKFMKITVVDCLRCLSKAVYWFSQIDYEQVEDILLLSKLSKELFSEMTKLLIETSDYATQCYIIGAFHNFAQREYTNKDILSELLIENLNGTIYFESQRLDNLDRAVGWNAAIGTLPECKSYD